MKFTLIARLIPVLLALGICATPASAQAYVAVSNLADNPFGTTNTISELQWTASSFTTNGASASYDIQSITLRMNNATIDNTFFAGFRVSVYTNGANNRPGTEIAAFSAGDIGTGEPVVAGDYSYAVSGAPLLANTTYWTVVSVQSSQPLGVYKANLVFNTDSDPGSTWTLGKYTSSSDAGATWGFASNGALLMSIQTSPSAIPEPSTYAALAGCAALAFAWRRGRRSVA